MNKYQRKEHKEIKRLMRLDPFGRITYRQAKRVARLHKRIKESEVEAFLIRKIKEISDVVSKMMADGILG